MSHLILSGSAGFVGSHVLRHVLDNTTWTVACPVSFRHKGLPARLAEVLSDAHADRVTVVRCDLASPLDKQTLARLAADECDIIYNIASESHVDRAIAEPVPFVENNISLMLHTLEAARQMPNLRLFLHMGTDEEYGPAYGEHKHAEWETVVPSNPYSASKAAQSALAVAWWRTYGLPIVLTRTMNLISPMQSAEKYLPMVIRSVLAGDIVSVHASPDGVPGARHWIDARQFAGAWLHLAEHKPAMFPDETRPDMFHVVGDEYDNLEVAQMVADVLGKPLRYELTSFHASRPGHDLRYALDGTKLADAGWRVERPLEESIRDIVEWYMANPEWLDV